MARHRARSAHAPVAVDVWLNQAAMHTKLTILPVRSEEEMFSALGAQPDLVVMSWSTMQTIFGVKRNNRKGENALYENKPYLLDVAAFFSLVIIDEVHLVKTNTSLRFRMVSILTSNCYFRLTLTGTPVGRDPGAVWGQAFVTDMGQALHPNFYFFREVFTVEKRKGFGAAREFNSDLTAALGEKLASISLAYDKDELTVSNIHMCPVPLMMEGGQRRAYDEAEGLFFRQAFSVEPSERENLFTTLRQISSGFLTYVDSHGEKQIRRFANHTKQLWLEDRMPRLRGASAVIFTEFTESGRHVCALLDKMGITYRWLYGNTPPKRRTEWINDFQSGHVQVLVANSVAGGTSIDLNRADHLIFFESPCSPIYRAQAEARPMGERGDRPVYVMDLAASRVERRVLSFLSEGKDVMKSLMNYAAELKRQRKERII